MLTTISDTQIGEAIIAQYQKSPTIDKVRSSIPQTNKLNNISWPALFMLSNRKYSLHCDIAENQSLVHLAFGYSFSQCSLERNFSMNSVPIRFIEF